MSNDTKQDTAIVVYIPEEHFERFVENSKRNLADMLSVHVTSLTMRTKPKKFGTTPITIRPTVDDKKLLADFEKLYNMEHREKELLLENQQMKGKLEAVETIKGILVTNLHVVSEEHLPEAVGDFISKYEQILESE